MKTISRALLFIGLLTVTTVGIFSLSYLSKRKIDEWFKPEKSFWPDDMPVIWNGTVDWEYDMKPRPALPKAFVFVRTLEEAVAQPIGTWIMDPDGRVGQVAKHAEKPAK